MVAPYHLILTKQAAKNLQCIPLPWRQRLILTLDLLPADPLKGEKLEGRLEGQRKLRVWPYRLIYLLDHKNKFIVMLWIERRPSVYR